MIITQLINLRSAVRSFATVYLKKKTEKGERFYTISFKRSFFKTLKEGKKKPVAALIMMYKNKRSLGTKFPPLNEKENGWKKWAEYQLY